MRFSDNQVLKSDCGSRVHSSSISKRRLIWSRARFAVTALLILCVTVIFPSSPIIAQITSSDLLDFILILDESGSMRYNDPDRIRVDASRLFVDLLHPDDRMAVIGFGGEARVISPLVKTGSGRSRIEDGLATVGSTQTKLPADYGKFSMIGDATKTADSLLRVRTDPRKSVVLIFTDGEFQEDDIRPGISLAEHLNLTYDAAGVLGDQGSFVVACAFTKAANLDVLSRVARQGGGFTEKVNNAADINDVFLRILKLLPGVGHDSIEPGVASKTFILEDNIWKLSLLAIKAKPDGPSVDITLTGPDGQTVTGERIDSRLYTVLNVTDPKPGQYTATVPIENRLEVQIIRRGSLSLNIISPRAGERLVATGQPLPVILSAAGRPNLQIEGEMVTPQGSIIPLVVSPDRSLPGDSLYRTEIQPKDAGSYHAMFAIVRSDGTPLGASAVLQFTAVDGIEGSVSIDPGYANVGSPIYASAKILPGLPIVSPVMIVTGPETHDTLQMDFTGSQGSYREYTATYHPPSSPGVYHADIVLTFESSGENLVQHKSVAAPKIFSADSTAKYTPSDEQTADLDINVKAIGYDAEFSMSPCNADLLIVKPEKETWSLPKDKEVSCALSLSSQTAMSGNLALDCEGLVEVEALGKFPVKLSLALTPSIPFKLPTWLLPILILVGLLIIMLIFCRLRPQFDRSIVLQVESTGEEIAPAEYQKFCRGAIYANRDVFLDAALLPKSLRLKSSGPGVVEMTVLTNVEGIIVDGEQAVQGRRYRLFVPCEIMLPSGKVKLDTTDIEINDIQITQEETGNE